MSPRQVDSRERPEWERVANHVSALIRSPTDEQRELARQVGVDLSPALPSYVAAVILRHSLQSVLHIPMRVGAELPEALHEIESEMRIPKKDRAVLSTGTREEVTAWFTARYALKTVRGLRLLKPSPGDVVSSEGWGGESRIVSSIGPDGRVYMKGRPSRSAWPNNLELVLRKGGAGYSDAVGVIDAHLRNGARYADYNHARLDTLREFEVKSHVPSPEAVRALEELLESGQRMEEPFQILLTQHPALLAAATVIGGWSTYVIPKQRLGAEHVPDFLVLSVNSLGLQWVAVEIEAARHRILVKDGSLSGPTRHAVKQVEDWREWLTRNVAYAQDQLHLYGLTNRAPGLVLIGRADPKTQREPARGRSEEESRIAIHSWDWLLRQARRTSVDSLHASDFTQAHVLQGERWPADPRRNGSSLASPSADGAFGDPDDDIYLDDDF
jgi:hypothetical protein